MRTKEVIVQLETSSKGVALKDRVVHQLSHVKVKQHLYMWAKSYIGTTFIVLYVDGLVIGGEHLVETKKVKSLLIAKFETNDMNKLHYFLGIEVVRTDNNILLSQCHYILNLLFKFGMMNHKPILTPPDRNMKLHAVL